MTTGPGPRAAGDPRSPRRPGRPSAPVLVLVSVLALVVLAGCAATAAGVVVPGPDRPGFWLGLWHGLILPIAFVVSLFDDHVAVYSVPNSGHLYDLGFVLGAILIPSPSLAARRGSRRRSATRA